MDNIKNYYTLLRFSAFLSISGLIYYQLNKLNNEVSSLRSTIEFLKPQRHEATYIAESTKNLESLIEETNNILKDINLNLYQINSSFHERPIIP